jgi:plasmid stabilization system protein ParE/PHD/YefM family antitoxin component YafN of YafNO toxin-antitoxin module
MLDLANDIRSLSDFKRNTVDLLDRLRKTGHPLVLTINGKAELVVQDAEAYQALLDRVEAIEGIQRGLADVKAGRTKPARQVCSLGSAASMAYRVEIARNAVGDLEELYLWMVARAPQQGTKWFNGLEQAVLSLDQHPRRCPVAPESIDPDHPVRVMSYGRKPRVYRIFFTVDDALILCAWCTCGGARGDDRLLTN